MSRRNYTSIVERLFQEVSSTRDWVKSKVEELTLDPDSVYLRTQIRYKVQFLANFVPTNSISGVPSVSGTSHEIRTSLLRFADDIERILGRYFIPLMESSYKFSEGDIQTLLNNLSVSSNLVDTGRFDQINNYWRVVLERIPDLTFEQRVPALAHEGIDESLKRGVEHVRIHLQKRSVLNDGVDAFLDESVLNSYSNYTEFAGYDAGVQVFRDVSDKGSDFDRNAAQMNHAYELDNLYMPKKLEVNYRGYIHAQTDSVKIRLPLAFKSAGALLMQFERVETAYGDWNGAVTASDLAAFSEFDSESRQINQVGEAACYFETALEVSERVIVGSSISIETGQDVDLVLRWPTSADMIFTAVLRINYRFIPSSRNVFLGVDNTPITTRTNIAAMIHRMPLNVCEKLTDPLKRIMPLLSQYDVHLRRRDPALMLETIVDEWLTVKYRPDIDLTIQNERVVLDFNPAYYSLYPVLCSRLKYVTPTVNNINGVRTVMSDYDQEDFYDFLMDQFSKRWIGMMSDVAFLRSLY
jgi:hypothetical protein